MRLIVDYVAARHCREGQHVSRVGQLPHVDELQRTIENVEPRFVWKCALCGHSILVRM